jgi:dephospho-CoA kinase
MTCSKSSRSKRPPRRNRVLRVALTGGIACGKSVVARLLAAKGAFIYSADEAAHALMRPGRPAWKRIVARFGPSILRPDRTIDRSALGPLVFSDAAARRFLDRLIHPLVLADQARTVRRLAREGRVRIFVVEAALTVEAGYAGHFDRVVVVHCRKSDQVRRLRARDGTGPSAALRKIGTQMPVREKLRHADYAVDTSGTLAGTVEQTERVYAQLMRDAEMGSNLKSRNVLERRHLNRQK